MLFKAIPEHKLQVAYKFIRLLSEFVYFCSDFNNSGN